MKWWAFLLGTLYALHRLALWMERRGWIYYLRRKPDPHSLGTAFLELHQLAQPDRAYLLEARRNEQAQRDDQGGPDRPEAPGGAQPTP